MRLPMDQLFYIIAITVTVIVLLFFGVQKLYAGNNAITETDCRQSIQLHSKLIRAGGTAAPISCSPHTVEINNRDETKAKEALAQELAFCWDRWQRGQVELFDMSGGIYCNPCSIITFTDPDRPLTGFTRFLSTARNADGSTYLDYLSSSSSSGAGDAIEYAPPDPSADTLPTDKRYATIFIYAKGASVQTIKENFGKNPRESTKQVVGMTAVGAAVGTVTSVGFLIFGVATGGVGFVIGGVVLGAAVGGGGEYFFGSAPKPEWVAFTVLQPYDAPSLTGLNCTKVEQQGVAKMVAGGGQAGGVENLN